jgi:hypothetical protein
MQRSDPLVEIQMHHHRGVLPMRTTSGLTVPPGLDQPHERLASARQRRPILGGPVVVVIALPLGDQRILVRLQRRIEFRRVHMRQFDPPTGELLVGGFGD